MKFVFLSHPAHFHDPKVQVSEPLCVLFINIINNINIMNKIKRMHLNDSFNKR